MLKVQFNNYLDLCQFYTYGKELLDQPAEVIEAIDELFNGAEFDAFGAQNPDNLYINSFTELSFKELKNEWDLNTTDVEALYNELSEQVTVLHIDEANKIAYVLQ